MFKKIQNYLLLHHPLIWNIKLLPVLLTIIIFHIVFFSIGYVQGELDFNHFEDFYTYDNIPKVIMFFSVLISILVFIIWLVFYLRNNAFKSFYAIGNSSLYKEWLLILLICTLNCTYIWSFDFGSDCRARSYFDREEADRRNEIIDMASFFTGFDFEPRFDGRTEEFEGTQASTFVFNNKRYSVKSLINKTVSTARHSATQSGYNQRIRMWLSENRKDSVQ